MTGYEDGPPVRARVAFTDFQAARYGALALLLAIQHRRRTARGQHIDLAQYECGAWWVGPALMDYFMNGRVQGRMGNRHHVMAPHGCYRCAGDDKWVTLAVGSDEEWKGLCEAMDQPSLAQDDRFTYPASRLKHQDELDSIINDWTSAHDQYEVMHLLQSKGVASGPVLNSKGVLTDPHLKARNFWDRLTSPEEATNVGTRLYPRMPWLAKKAPPPQSIPAPTLGQHNREILTGILGLSDEDLRELEAEGIIGTEVVGVPTPVPPSIENMKEQGLIQEHDGNFMEVLGLNR
jgi:crotonobetainyl-CoA:carnitine CoA-transferase CaiB-like acyl-CoA transferase